MRVIDAGDEHDLRTDRPLQREQHVLHHPRNYGVLWHEHAVVHLRGQCGLDWLSRRLWHLRARRLVLKVINQIVTCYMIRNDLHDTPHGELR